MNIGGYFIDIYNILVNSKRNIIAILNVMTNLDKIYDILDNMGHIM